MQASTYPRGLPKGKALKACSENSAGFIGTLAGELHKAGYEPVTSEWINGQSKYLIFNRGYDEKSNFYVFVRPKRKFLFFKGGKVEVTFTNPRTDASATSLKKDQVIVKMKFGSSAGQAEATKCVNKVVETAKGKKENEYYFHTHGHMGKMFNPNKSKWESIWDDGVSKDIDCLMQAMFWNYDFFSLTSHNWCHNRLRIGWMNRIFSEVGMTFVPGCEITMPSSLKDESGTMGTSLWRGPHILVHCADGVAALEIQGKLLAEKLRQKTGLISPILSGPPMVIEDQLKLLEPYFAMGEISVSGPHLVSSLLNGAISLFGKKTVGDIGYSEVWRIALSGIMSGAERMNCGETLSTKPKFSDEETQDLTEKLCASREGYPIYLSSPNLNRLLADILRANGKNNYIGHDDHELPPVGQMCTYGWGVTKFIVTDPVRKMLAGEWRKPRSDEIVYSMSKGVFPGTSEKVLCEAVMFTKETDKGPDVVEARKPTAWEKIVDSIREGVPYTADLLIAEARFFGAMIFGNKFMGREYWKEVEKAKIWKSEESRFAGIKGLASKVNLSDGFKSLKSLSSRIRASRPKQ